MHRTSLHLLAIALLAMVLSACLSRSKMCDRASECGPAACVAGRCQPDAGTPVVQTARRLVVEPVDVAYIFPGQSAADPVPAFAVLGQGPARLLLRFSLPAMDQEVVEAYVILQRVDAYPADVAPISLHAARIVEPWASGSTAWGTAPQTEDVQAPLTTVSGTAGRPLVRMDVRELVRKWKARDPRDQGIAVVARQTSRSGMAFALVTGAGLALEPRPGDDRPAYIRGPVLEMYVK